VSKNLYHLIPSVLEVQLEAKITAALAKDYGLTTEKNHDLTLDNVQGTFLEHTITWKVTRVKGLIEVIYGDGIAQVGFEKIANVELYNRTSQSLGCSGNDASISPTTIVATLETQPPAIQPTPVPNQPSYAEILCPYAITQSDVNSFNKGVADVSTVRTYINQFDAGRPNDGGAFTKGTKIPAGVVIATNFDEVNASAWSQYPVIPLVHSGSWGLFQSTAEYIAPNAGACRVIIP
jgi:hypothetical protein